MRLPSIVNTDIFKTWFGNSKVVDSNGNPLIVYKGMYPYDYTREDEPPLDTISRPSSFPSFDPQDQEPVHIAGFFTDQPDVASKFIYQGGAMFPVFLRIEHPAIFDAAGKPSGTIQFGPEGKPFRDAVRSGRYDGVFILNTEDEGNVYIPIKSNQIKSAIFSKFTEDPRLSA
jgi:hypothetical protein